MLKTVFFLVLVGLGHGFNFFDPTPINPKYYESSAIRVQEDNILPQKAPLPGQGKCNKFQLEYCQKRFSTDLGEKNATLLFSDPSYFGKVLRELYSYSLTEGLLLVCASRDSYHNCLGEDYHPCTDVFNIIREHKYTMRDAFLLADIYNDLEFDCNGGLAQSTRHWDCINKVHKDPLYSQHALECFKQYNDTIIKNPHGYCKAAEGFSFCVTTVYQNFPDCFNKEILWWECERLLRRSQLDGFCYNISCHKVFELEDFKQAIGLSYQEKQKIGFKSPAKKLLYRQLADKERNFDKH